MSAPDDRAIVQATFDPSRHELTTKIGCGRFRGDAVWALHQSNGRWGELKKHAGQNNWQGYAVDNGLWREETAGQSQAVDFVAASESSDARLAWQPDVPRYSPSDWVAPTGPDAFILPAHHCQLGASFFWYFGAWRKHRHGEAGWKDKIDTNAEWIANTLHADYVRTFATVGGNTSNPQGQDPWSIIGTFYHWPDWEDTIASGIEYLPEAFGLKHAITLVGEGAQFANDARILEMVDRMALLASEFTPQIFFVEMWNEYEVTGGNREIVRAMGERFHQGCPTVPFALDTPPGAMSGFPEGNLQPLWEQVSALYGGTHASVITPQWNRSEPNPLDLGPSARGLIHVSHEPRGPGASAGGDVHNPLPLMNDYIQAAMANQIHMAGPVVYSGYTAHSQAGVWGGHCNPAFPAQNTYADWYSLPTAPEIAHVLSAIRAGHLPTGEPEPEPDPHRPDQLLWGEVLKVGDALSAGDYRCQLQPDGNLVTYHATLPVWATNTFAPNPGNLAMQGDGNLVLYTSDGQALWASHTEGHPGAMAQLNPDGVLVVYADPSGDQAGTPLWSSRA